MLTKQPKRDSLLIEEPKMWYMNVPKVEWFGFRSYWRQVMQEGDIRESTIVWRDGWDRDCRMNICTGCDLRTWRQTRAVCS